MGFPPTTAGVHRRTLASHLLHGRREEADAGEVGILNHLSPKQGIKIDRKEANGRGRRKSPPRAAPNKESVSVKETGPGSPSIQAGRACVDDVQRMGTADS